MTETAANVPDTPVLQTSERAVVIKWLIVLAALVLATVLDGLAVRNAVTPALSLGEQTAITMPAERCEPGCTIMVASNQPNRL